MLLYNAISRGLQFSEIVHYTRRPCLYRITTLFPNERSRFEAIYVSSESTTSNHFVRAAIVCQLSEYIFPGCHFLALQRPVWEAWWTPLLLGLAATQDGQIWLSCKLITKCMLSFVRPGSLPYRACKVNAHCFKWSWSFCWQSSWFKRVVTWNFLHPYQALLTPLVSRLNHNTQYCWRTKLIVSSTPPWRFRTYLQWTILSANKTSGLSCSKHG